MATRKKEDVAAAIKAANKALGAALATGDAKAVAAKYTKTAKLLAANVPVQKGHAAIARFWQGAIDMGVSGAQLRTVDLDVHGNTANELGAYILKDAKGNKLDQGKYVVIWKKERGNWKLHWDIFNTNNPA
jgi:ketosteroid isomerase-like protein